MQHYDAQEFRYLACHPAGNLTSCPCAYKGFYNSRYINAMNWDLAEAVKTSVPDSFDAASVQRENRQLQATISGNESDKGIAQAIRDKG